MTDLSLTCLFKAFLFFQQNPFAVDKYYLDVPDEITAKNVSLDIEMARIILLRRTDYYFFNKPKSSFIFRAQEVQG